MIWKANEVLNPEKYVVALIEEGKLDEAYFKYSDNIINISRDYLEPKLEELINKIKDEFNSGEKDYKTAMEELYTVLKMADGDLETQTLQTIEFLKEINDSRIAYLKALFLSGSKDYIGAIEQYRKVSINDDNYNSAKLELMEIIEKYREITLNEVTSLVEKQEYQKAKDILNNALAIIGEDPILESQINICYYLEEQFLAKKAEVHIQDIIADSNVYANNKDFTSARDIIVKALLEFIDNIDLTKQLETLANEEQYYFNNNTIIKPLVLEKAEELANISDFKGARKALEEFSSTFADDPEINEKIAEIDRREYAEQVKEIIAQAEGYASDGLEVKAMTTISEGLDKFPGNIDLESKFQEYIDRLGVNANIVSYKHTDAVEVYRDYWNAAVPFKVSGEIIEQSNVHGIRFKTGDWFGVYDGFTNFVTSQFGGIVIKLDNSELIFTKIIFKIARDDLSYKEIYTNKYGFVVLTGYAKALGVKYLIDTEIQKDDAYSYYEADITGYEEIYINIDLYQNYGIEEYSESVGDVIKEDVYQDYLLFVEPKMYK
jgi:tetratricopeptide (TPR) repeat protein